MEKQWNEIVLSADDDSTMYLFTDREESRRRLEAAGYTARRACDEGRVVGWIFSIPADAFTWAVGRRRCCAEAEA